MSNFYNFIMDNKEFLKALGLKIKVVRTLKEISRDDISNAIGVDKSYLSKLERGLANPTIIYLKAIADYFGIDVKDFFDLNTYNI